MRPPLPEDPNRRFGPGATNTGRRRIGGGTWLVSKAALAMFLDGDMKALQAYHAVDRTGPIVMPHSNAWGLGYLLLARKSQPGTEDRFLRSSEKEKGDA
jgi:hypothetical protein